MNNNNVTYLLKSDELAVEDIIHKIICSQSLTDKDSGFFMILLLMIFIIGKTVVKTITRRNAVVRRID